jgi:hypothetical protein
MAVRSRDKLNESVASTIADYRQGEIDPPTPQHVETWIEQFDEKVRTPILVELDHVLKETYISKANVETFLSGIIKNTKLTGNSHCSFWKAVNFLDIQGGGESQREMLAMFDPLLKESCGFGVDDCGAGSDVYFYLDDISFSGRRALVDLENWLKSEAAPESAEVHIVVMAYHMYGQWWASNKLSEAARVVGKKIKFHWWRCLAIEDRKAYISTSEVLRPTEIPDDPLVQAYARSIEEEGRGIVLRKPGGKSKIFSSEEGRHLLEQEFLRKGAEIRRLCPNLPKTHHPLGFSGLRMLGFGSLHVTFRNCPNNCPLVFWVDFPWYPLFPRKNN